MSILRPEDSQKWISLFLVLAAGAVVVISMAFFRQLADWFFFDNIKEAQLEMGIQGVSILLGLGAFWGALRVKKTRNYLNEVYAELVKVVWSKREDTVKLTMIIVVALGILGLLFVGIDLVFQKLLELFY